MKKLSISRLDLLIKSFAFSFFFIFLVPQYSEASEKIIDNIDAICDGNLKNSNTDELEIEKFEVDITKIKKWNKNLLKINLEYQKKLNIRKDKEWVSNFRIKKDFKKKFKAKVFVKYKNYKSCIYDARVRVTGDMSWHLDWNGGKPATSLQVELLNGNIYNATKFKLLLKTAREESNEVFVANLFTELGFVSPKTFLLTSKINDIQIEYIFQEDLRKEMIERMGLRESVILEGDERFTINLDLDDSKKYNYLNYSRISNTNFLNKSLTNLKIGLESISNYNKVYFYNHKYKYKNKIYDPWNDFFYLFTDKHFEDKNKLILNTFESLSYALDTVHNLSMDDRRFYYDPFNKFFLPIYYDGKSNILSDNPKFVLSKDVENVEIPNEAILGSKSAKELINSLNKINLLNKLNKSGFSMQMIDLENLLKKITHRLDIINTIKLKDNNFILGDNFYKTAVPNNTFFGFIRSDYRSNKIVLCDIYENNCSTYHDINNQKIFSDIISGKMNNINKILKKENKQQKNLIFTTDVNLAGDEFFKYLDEKWERIKIKNTLVKSIGSKIQIKPDTKIIEITQIQPGSKVIFLGGLLDDWKIFFSGLENKVEQNNYENYNYLTGCLTFYEVEFENVSINSKFAHCEDAINIVRSKGNINSINIVNSDSDSLDADFSNIVIKNITVKNSLNDCSDFSSGYYVIIDSYFHNCKDKAISVGEKSKMLVKNIFVDGSLIGVASKDSSITEIVKGKLLKTDICMAAYRKKIEFSGGMFFLHNVDCNSQKNFISKDSNLIYK